MIKVSLKALAILFVLTFLFTPTIFKPVDSTGVKDVAIYVGPGAESRGVLYLTSFLESKGYSYSAIDEKDILNGALDKAKVFILPGGWAGEVDEYGNKGYGSMSAEAVDKIKQFVENGGGFYGICAGAYFATKKVKWENALYDEPLGIFNGLAIGPIDEIAPWPLSTWTSDNISSNMNLGFNHTTSLYWGGPYFESNQTNFTILERYGVNGKPATIQFTYYKGPVILTGLHHEWPNYQNSTINNENEHILGWIINYLLKNSKVSSGENFGISQIHVGLLVVLAILAISTFIYLKKRKQ